MKAIWRKKLMTLIGSMIPSGLMVKTDFGDEVVIGYQIRTDADEFDAIIITSNQNEHQGVYRLEDVKPYLRTYGQLIEPEIDQLDYLDDDHEKTEIGIALSYMRCAMDRDGENEFIKRGYALQAPDGMYAPEDWDAYEQELCDESYERLTTLEEKPSNFSNDDLDDDDDYDEE